MADSLSRRRFLALVPVASAGGCLGSIAQEDEESGSPDMPALTGITIQNRTFRPREVAATVEKEGEVVYEGSQQLDGISSKSGTRRAT